MAQEQSRPLTAKEIVLLAKNKPSEYFNKIKDQIHKFDDALEGFHPDVFAIDEKLLVQIPTKYLHFLKEYDASPDVFAQFMQWLPFLMEAVNSSDVTVYFQKRGKLLKSLEVWKELYQRAIQFENIKKAASSVEWNTIGRVFEQITDKNRVGNEISQEQFLNAIHDLPENVKDFLNDIFSRSEAQRFALSGLEDDARALEVKKRLSLETVKRTVQVPFVGELKSSSGSFYQAQDNNNRRLADVLDVRLIDLGFNKYTVAQVFQNETGLSEEIAEKFLVYTVSGGKCGLTPPNDKQWFVLLQQFMGMSDEFETVNIEFDRAHQEFTQASNEYQKLEDEIRQEMHSVVQLPNLEDKNRASNKKGGSLKKQESLSFPELLNWLDTNKKSHQKELLLEKQKILLQKQESVSEKKKTLSERRNQLFIEKQRLEKFCSQIEIFEYYVQTYFVELIEKSKDFLTKLSLLPNTQKTYVEKQVYKFFGLTENGARGSRSEDQQKQSDQVVVNIKILGEIKELEESWQNLLCQFKKLTHVQQETIIERQVYSLDQSQFINQINALGVLEEVKKDIDSLRVHIQQMEASGIYHDANLVELCQGIEKKYKNIVSWGNNRSLLLDLIIIKQELQEKYSAPSAQKQWAREYYREVKKYISQHKNRFQLVTSYIEKQHLNEEKFFDAYKISILFLENVLRDPASSVNDTNLNNVSFLIKQAVHVVHIGWLTSFNSSLFPYSETRLQANHWSDQEVENISKITKQTSPKELLTESMRLQFEAREALYRGNTDWFNLLMGLGYNYSQEIAKREIKNGQLEVDLRRLNFSMKIINQQKALLQEHLTTDLTNPTVLQTLHQTFRQQLDELRQNEMDFLAEKLQKQKNSSIYVGQDRVNVSSSNIQEVLVYYKQQYVDSVVKDLTLYFKSDSVLKNIFNDLTTKFDEFSRLQDEVESEQAKTWNDIQVLDSQKGGFQHTLRKAAAGGKLPPDYKDNLESIASALSDHVIDIDYEDEKKNTLLHVAFVTKNAEATKLLLERGANILKKNADGISVFAMALENLKNPAFKAVINEINGYLKASIQKIIPKEYAPYSPAEMQRFMKHETESIDGILSEVTRYHGTTLQKNIGLPFIRQILTGVWFHLEERKEQCETYYEYLARAATYKEDSTLITYIHMVLATAKSAGRGILGGNSLNGPVEKKSQEIIDNWEKNKQDHERRRAEMHNRRLFSHMDDQLKAEKLRSQNLEKKVQETTEESQRTKAELQETKVELQETKMKLEETEKKVEINKRELEDKFTKELSERDKQLEYLMSYVKSQQNNNAGAKEPNQSTGTEAPRESGQNQNTGPGFFDHSNKAQVPPVVLNPANGSKPGQPLVEASENSVLDGPK